MRFSLSLLIVVAVLSYNKADDFDYRYQSKWYDINDQCSYNRQSPIELSSEEAVITGDIPALRFYNYNLTYTKPVVASNNGHTANLQLPKPDSYIDSLWQTYDRFLPTISGGLLLDARFVTESVHFHWGSKDTHGSEHVINNQRYSMEMHILHRNTKYQTVEEAKKHTDGLAVLAVFYHVKPNQLTAFKGLEHIIDALVGIKEFNHSAQIENFTLSELLGDMSTLEFYTYQGSLTTPPCSQAVQWIVFPQVINISHNQIKHFRSLSDSHGEVLENNYRHLQPKGPRKVFYRQKHSLIDDVISSPNFWTVMDKLKPQPWESSIIMKALTNNNNNN
ncbi:carbonic anhydrase 2-like [Lucilia cuprina]|uniref:carbonic anhydrase 2-like n=1 Tax=Lucilia cuprina TaxID=7375 RepID=UPI001F060D15|nr:carbonic anhydrase 2-like [Lucilia cuprina]